jgi:hypothetical protein
MLCNTIGRSGQCVPHPVDVLHHMFAHGDHLVTVISYLECPFLTDFVAKVPLRLRANDDSIIVTRSVMGASDNGAAQRQPGSALLFFLP